MTVNIMNQALQNRNTTLLLRSGYCSLEFCRAAQRCRFGQKQWIWWSYEFNSCRSSERLNLHPPSWRRSVTALGRSVHPWLCCARPEVLLEAFRFRCTHGRGWSTQ